MNSSWLSTFALLLICTLFLCKPAHAQLSGLYTVGSGGDFRNLTEAIEQLNRKGVQGPTTFQIRNGRYEEQVKISSVRGASDQNPIIIESASGNPRDVTLFYQHVGASANNNEHVIRVDSTDYVTVRNLTIENPGEIYGTGLRIMGAAHTTFSGNIVQVTPKPQFAQPLNSCIFAINAPDLVVQHCVLDGGYAGVHATGLNDSILIANMRIEGNRMSNGALGLGGSGVWLKNYYDVTISGNTITQGDGTGLSIDNCNGQLRIEANRITLRPERFGIGVSVTESHAEAKRSLIANNVVMVVDGDTLTANLGMTFSEITNADILFNTVHVANFNTDRFQSTTNVAVSFNGFNNDSLRIFNNIFTNLRGREVIVYPIGNAYYESDYNNLYTTGDILGRSPSGVGVVPTLDSLQSGSGIELHSYSVSPCYSLRTNLQTNSEVLDGSGRGFPEVPTDINGKDRSPLNPDIGAFEYDFKPNGLSGTYTVGTGGDYETLREAIEELHTRCVEGPVEFALLPGIYNEQNTIKSIPGTSSANTVTLRSQSGNPEDAVLSRQFTWFTDYLLRLKEAENIVLKDLTIQALDTLYSGVSIWLVGKTNNIQFLNNNFLNGTEDVRATNTNHIYSDDESIPANLLVDGNRFLSGIGGVVLSNCFGFDCPDEKRVQGTRVVNNQFLMNDTARDFRSPISVQHHLSPIIDGNTIASYGSGISLTQCAGLVQVTNNKIDVRGTDFASSVATGISFTFPSRTEPFGLVANNMVRAHDPIHLPDRMSSLVGVNLGQSKNMFVLYNTIVVQDSVTESVALSIPFGTDSVVLYNNILANYSGGPAQRIKFVERFYKEFGFDYNLLYTTGDTIAIWNDTGRTSLAAIQSVLGTDSNSIVADPQFLSDSDLHIASTSTAVNAGFAINSFVINDIDYTHLIANDIDGEPRGTDVTEIGADELDITRVDIYPGVRNGEHTSLEITGANPLRQHGRVHFSIASLSHVRLAIVDMQGEEMQILTNREYHRGEHSVQFEITKIPAGIYWIALTTQEGVVARKMIVLGKG